MVVMMALFGSFTALVYQETYNGDNFEETLVESHGFTIETTGLKWLHVSCESLTGEILKFQINITGSDGDIVYQVNGSTPFSDIYEIKEAGEYELTISMTKGAFNKMDVSVISIGPAMFLLPLAFLLLVPITSTLLVSGLVMTIISLYRCIRYERSRRPRGRPVGPWLGEMR